MKRISYDDYEHMLEDIRNIEKQSGVDMNIEEITFMERYAVRRNITANQNRMIMIDFMEGYITHNLMYSAPSGKYDRYLEITMTSMDTYETIPRDVSDDEAREHIVAQKVRLAQIFIERGDLNLALDFVNEGLEIDPVNSDLLEMKRQIED